MASAAAYLCAEEAGGCGALWTPTSDRRPVLAETVQWAWCPDCLLTQQAEPKEPAA